MPLSAPVPAPAARFGPAALLGSIALLGIAALAGPAYAQKAGGVLKVEQFDNPPSGSILEEATVGVVVPFMAIYSNLVIYDQHVPQNSIDSIRPELATAWTWNDDKSALTFTLRDGVKWHDGKPFTSADVKCTFDMLIETGTGPRLRKNPRGAWYSNLGSTTTDGPTKVTFTLKRPQPAFIALLASGYSPIYPCHVPTATMRTAPVGTGPFKLAEFRPNDSIRLVRNPDYWKPGLPYLDGIDFRVIPSRSTRMLAFISGEFDMTFPTDVTPALMRDVQSQAPHTQCKMRPSNVTTNLIINRDAPPFDNPDLRRALALTLDRQAFIDILSDGQATIGGTMLPPPAGVWGMPPDMLKTVFGYGDVAKNREQARAIMRKLGYGPDNRMPLKVSTRNIPTFRDPATIFLDQLKEIYIDAQLEIIDTSVYYNTVFKKDYSVGINQTGSAVDDPDQHFYENYACGSLRNYTAYCNPEIQKLFDAQSAEVDQEKRKHMVWEIDRKLQEDVARPIIVHGVGGACWQPKVKNLTIMVNSIYNGWRFEDVWLDPLTN